MSFAPRTSRCWCRRRRRASSTTSRRRCAARSTDTSPRYDAMFARENARVGGVKTKLDPMPRVVLVPGVGLFGVGATRKDAAIAADLAENSGQRHHRRRGDRPLRGAARGRPVRRRVLEPGAGQAERRGGQALHRPDGGGDGCRQRHRHGDGQGVRGGRRGGRRARPRRGARPRPRPRRSAALGLPAT